MRGVKGREIKPIVEVVGWIEISNGRRNWRSQEPGKKRLSIQGIEEVSRLRHSAVYRGLGTIDIPQDIEIAEREAVLVRVDPGVIKLSRNAGALVDPDESVGDSRDRTRHTSPPCSQRNQS